MNKQGPKGIGWCDYTWNVVSGCWGPGGTAEKPNRCHYCLARGIAERFRPKFPMGDDCSQPEDGLHEIRYKGQPWRYGFAPTFHSYRLGEPAKIKKPSKIFVCSMADLFGDWVPSEWIEAVLNRTQRADYSHHTYQFLTKNPKRLNDFNPWPSNCWVGCTVTNQTDADLRLPWLLKVDAPVRFVSHEPLLGKIADRASPWGTWFNPQYGELRGINWAIFGAMTGPGPVKVDVCQVAALVNQYHDAGIPVFMKNNLKPPMGRLIQEFPT